MILEVYANAEWARLVTDRRSTSSYCTFLGGNLVIRGVTNSMWLLG